MPAIPALGNLKQDFQYKASLGYIVKLYQKKKKKKKTNKQKPKTVEKGNQTGNKII
jgi:hypothetical protein